ALARLATRPNDAAQVLEAAHGLSRLGRCADSEALLGLLLPELDESEQQRLAATRAQIESVRVEHRAGLPIERAKLRDAVSTFRDLGHRPLEARALDLLAKVRLVDGIEGVVEARHEALAAAIAGGDRHLTARFFAELAEVVGYSQRDLEAAARWQGLAEASLATLGEGRDEVELEVRNSFGLVALSARDYAAAAEHYRRALELTQRPCCTDDVRQAGILNNLYVALVQEPVHRDEAIRSLERSIELKTRVYGPSHPSLIPSLLNLAGLQAEDGHYQAARDLIERCRQMGIAAGNQALDAFPVPTSQALRLQAHLLNILDHPRAAANLTEHAMGLTRQAFSERHPIYLNLLMILAESRLLQLRVDEANQLLAEARERSVDDPSRTREQARLELLLGRARLAAGDPRGALAHLAGVDSILPDGFRDLYGRWALELAQAQARLDTGETEAGLAELRQLVADPGGTALPALLAEARFKLAVHLPPAQRDEAIELARQAHDDLLPRSPKTQALQADIVAWLDAAGE
ncbi:MAG: tetratricopeptide repeat protein, partial [Acidobacteriota bacterium]